MLVLAYSSDGVKGTYKEGSSTHLRSSPTRRDTDGYTVQRRNYGGIITLDSLKSLKEKRYIPFLLSFVVHNTKPVGHQVSLQ